MTENGILIGIILICAGIIIVMTVMKKSEWIINTLLRMIAGGVGIYVVNQLLLGQGLEFTVGINAMTLAVTGVLGIPGIVMLYALKISVI